MTKEAMKAIADRYGMSIERDPITREATRLRVTSAELIPELDAICDSLSSVAGTRAYLGDVYTYDITCPTDWFDLWGWTD